MDLAIAISETKSQEVKNILILELTYRMYVPFQDETFEEMLVRNGYRVIDKDKNATL